ncbi:hypothetical protein Efla_004472 [Eimeria flavescens]
MNWFKPNLSGVCSVRSNRNSQELLGLQQDRDGRTSDDTHDVYAEKWDNDISHWKGRIKGPLDTPYEGGVFLLDITIPSDYPYNPPKISFVTKVWHPNVSSQTGAICLDILKHEWSPALSIRTALLSIQAMLADPVPTDPQDAEVAKMLIENPDLFQKTARFVKKLTDMGFEAEVARAALMKHNWDETSALNSLLVILNSTIPLRTEAQERCMYTADKRTPAVTSDLNRQLKLQPIRQFIWLDSFHADGEGMRFPLAPRMAAEDLQSDAVSAVRIKCSFCVLSLFEFPAIQGWLAASCMREVERPSLLQTGAPNFSEPFVGCFLFLLQRLCVSRSLLSFEPTGAEVQKEEKSAEMQALKKHIITRASCADFDSFRHFFLPFLPLLLSNERFQMDCCRC